MEKKEFSLTRHENTEVKRPFPLLQDLFTFAEKNGITVDGIGANPEQDYKTLPLPKAFEPLTETFPAKYLLTAYDDRRSAYYKEGTRYQMVRLSSVEHRSDTDARTREMDLKIQSGGRADRIEVRAREAVKDQAFAHINQTTGEEIEQPHGESRYTYELDENGKQYPKKLEYNRLDEGLFAFGGEMKPVRWVRRLEIEKHDKNPDRVTYQDLYIIGRNEGGVRDKRADVKVHFTGGLEHPEKVLMEIGFGSPASAQTLFEDKARQMKCIMHAPLPGDDPLEILKDDPVYGELLKGQPDTDECIRLIVGRIVMLRDEWDKPQNVYQNDRAVPERPPEIS